MKSITVEELEQINKDTCCVVDIRPQEQYERGTFPGAVSIPMDVFEENMDRIPKDRKSVV